MGFELGTASKNWESAKVRWALTYPELYEVGASNLGHIILYSILNKVPEQLCDRAYLPASDFAIRLRQKSQPLFAVESRRPLVAFDILGFSLSYELGATNILEMLDLSGIPLYAKDRNNLPLNHCNSLPLVFAGGPTATSNPEPFAAFFDFFALGDGEELLPEIGLVITESKAANLTRSEALIEISEIPGVYVPSLYLKREKENNIEPINSSIPKQITRRIANPMPQYAMGLVPNIETVHDRLTIEIRRGCTRGCRFCQPGMLTRPARDVAPREIISSIEKGIDKTGYSDFSLLSLSCSDYLALPAVGVELRNKLSDKNITLQLPSQRVDRFDNNIAHILGGARKAGLTFAPEAGSQRLRNIINKGLTDSDLLIGVRNAMENGYKKIKLYFMIGLPEEQDSDVLGIAETCKSLQEKCLDLGILSLNITISNFTPKPHTPFQWHSVSTAEFQRRQTILRDAFKAIKNIKVNFTDVRLSAIEDFIGRGDRRLAPVIKEAWESGAGMDAWFESIDKTYEAWTKAISNAGLEGIYRDLELGNGISPKSLTKTDLIQFCCRSLPWDHIDTGINKRWLAEDFQRALDESVVPDCSFHGCSNCGVCSPEFGHNIIVPPPPIPKQEPTKAPPSEKVCRIRFAFSKTTPMNLLSHLDLLRIFERSLRRSQLPVSYTGGFHPLPRLQLALALPLGIEAFKEWMDIDFYKQVKAEEIKDQLQNTLPKGISLKDAKEVPISKKSLSQELHAAIWSFDLSAVSSQRTSPLQWQKGINSLIEAKELIWNDKDKKGRPRKRDYRKGLHSLKIIKTDFKHPQVTNDNQVRMQLKAGIDPMGQSLKPMYIQYWLGQYLQQDLNIQDIKRDELLLHQC